MRKKRNQIDVLIKVLSNWIRISNVWNKFTVNFITLRVAWRSAKAKLFDLFCRLTVKFFSVFFLCVSIWKENLFVLDSRPPTYLNAVESTSIVNENFDTKRKRSTDFSTSNESKRLCFSPICIDDEVETSTSSSDNANRIQALLKKYLDSPSISVDPTPSDDDRISFSPDRIEPTTIYPCLSLDESISHQLPSVPIRPLSVSPNRFEETTTNQQQSAILTELLPKINDPKRNVWLSALSVSPEPSPITISVPFQLEQTLLSAKSV